MPRRILPALLVFGGLLAACGSEEEQSADGVPPVVRPEPRERAADTHPDPAPEDPGDPAGSDAPARAPDEEPWFVDVAAERGITQPNRTGKPRDKEFIMSTVGPGAAVFDCNGDGLLDLYVPNGNWLVGPMRDRFYEGDDRPRNALYVQQADGTFVDEARERGVDCDRWGFGACAADLDNDGDQDLIATNLGLNRLYINDGTGRFADIAGPAGMAGEEVEWSTGIAIGDYDRDGLLDVYVANYADMFEWMRTSPDIKRARDGSILDAAVCEWHRLEVYCGPQGLPGQQDRLFRNRGGTDGELRFEDVTRASGVWRPEESGGGLYGFQVLFTDLDRDGWLDVYIANDSAPSYFLRNEGDGTFREIARDLGIARGRMAQDMAGMGADTADVNGDGLLDVHKTNFAAQTNNLYIAEKTAAGGIVFRDWSPRTGIEKEVFEDLGWAVLVFDFDHDADRDIFYCNGHVYPEVDQRPELNMSYEQYNKLFRNDTEPEGKVRFANVSDDLGPGLQIRKCSRGGSLLDVDNDGDLDIFVVNLNDTHDLLINRRGNREGHWLQLRLRGDPERGVNREGIGAWLRVTAGGRTQFLEVKRGQGFLGCHDPRIHVAFGDHAGPVEIGITWPNGDTSTHVVEQVDREIAIAQP